MSNDADPARGWPERPADGDTRTAEPLCECYFPRLVRLAGAQLPAHGRRSDDGEDVAIGAFRSFCRRAGEGQFPALSDADELRRLLVVFTARKAIGSIRRENRRKRGGGAGQGESVFGRIGTGDEAGGLDAVMAGGPTPDLALLLVERYEDLLARREDRQMQLIAVLKLQDDHAEEIAQRLGTSKRTIARKPRIIRMTWGEAERPAEDAGA